jgi:hypothetical protein
MSELFSIIPGIVYDLIARIIPGAVVVYIFAVNQFFVRSSGLENFLMLVAMWAIGLTVDTVTDHPVRLVLRGPKCLFDRLPCIKRKRDGGDRSAGEWLVLPKTKYDLFYLDPVWRNVISKGMAERSFFRTMCAISFAVLCWKLSTLKLPSVCETWFQSPQWIVEASPCPFLILSALFFVCHWARGQEMAKELKHAESQITNEKEKLKGN